MMTPSNMMLEVYSAPYVVAQQQRDAGDSIRALAGELRERPPRHLFTVARGSSDHAASYLAYLVMSRLGTPVTSLCMSLVTLFNAPLSARDALAIAISQSGQSPDVVETMRHLDQVGARTVAMVNQSDSPLARACKWRVPICAGDEHSVAATKSFIASLSAAARLVAEWQQDRVLLAALSMLPTGLAQAAKQDWVAALEVLRDVERIVVVGRGLGLAIAQEAALKLKETCAIQAEAFSSAEIKHGPMALIDEGYPLLVFAPAGPAQPGLIALANEMQTRGARVILAAPEAVTERTVTLTGADHPDLDPITAIQSFYLMAEQLACTRGLNPDQPRHLSKVTRTV